MYLKYIDSKLILICKCLLCDKDLIVKGISFEESTVSYNFSCDSCGSVGGGFMAIDVYRDYMRSAPINFPVIRTIRSII